MGFHPSIHLSIRTGIATAALAILGVSLVASDAQARGTSTLSKKNKKALRRVASAPTPEPTKAQRVSHAQELMGKYYKSSVVRQGERHLRVDRFVKDWTRQALPTQHKKAAERLARTVLKTAKQYDFDPILLMAVIESESSFNPETRGGHGEIGLMQILPSTGAWMARDAGVRWKGNKTLLDPESNVKIGAAYLSWLRARFDSHAQLYLAAYNMGQNGVDGALKKDIWPQDYPFRVMNHYVKYYTELKHLSKERRERTLASSSKKSTKKSTGKKSRPQTLPVYSAETVRKAKKAVAVQIEGGGTHDDEYEQIRDFEQEADRLIDSADL